MVGRGVGRKWGDGGEGVGEDETKDSGRREKEEKGKGNEREREVGKWRRERCMWGKG